MRVLGAATVGRAVRIAVALSVAGLTLAGVAGPASATGGDNGYVKIHDAVTPDDDKRNNPKVCDFFVVGYNFDEAQEISWWIQEGPSFGQPDPPGVLDGALVADAKGFAKSELLSLPYGHYKLWWTFVGENGRAKHKVFKVDCAPKPRVKAEEICAEDGQSGLLVTLRNKGDADATFSITGIDGPVVVPPGESQEVLLSLPEDEEYTVVVSAMGKKKVKEWTFTGTLDCLPEVPVPVVESSESCDDGGVSLVLSNTGDADAVFVIDAGGGPEEVTVAPGEMVTKLIPVESGVEYSILVTELTTETEFAVSGALECEVDEEPPGENDEEPPAEGEPTPTPTEQGSTLPHTGAGFPTGAAAAFALLLVAVGGFLLTYRKGMLPVPVRRRH